MASGVLVLLLVVAFATCGLLAALPLATLRSLILDPIGLAVPFSLVLGLAVAFLLGGLLMVALQVRRVQATIPALPAARPATDCHLLATVADLSRAAGLKTVPPLFIVDSKGQNAFAYGFGRNSSSLAVDQGLIDLLAEPELRGILAHHISHIANEDTRLIALVEAFNRTGAAIRRIASHWRFNVSFTDAARGAGFLAIGTGALYGADRLSAALLPGNPPPESTSLSNLAAGALSLMLGLLLLPVVLAILYKTVKAGWKAIVYIALFMPVGLLIEALTHPAFGHLLNCGLSRQRAFIADADAAQLTGDPLALADALRRLEAHPTTAVSRVFAGTHSGCVMSPPPKTPPRWCSRLYAPYPPLDTRRKRLEATDPYPATPRPALTRRH